MKQEDNQAVAIAFVFLMFAPAIIIYGFMLWEAFNG